MTPYRTATSRVRSSDQARAVEAYLLTISEDYGATPAFGSTFMKEVITAFRSPEELKAMLPPRLQPRYDWWLNNLRSEQLDLFFSE